MLLLLNLRVVIDKTGSSLIGSTTKNQYIAYLSCSCCASILGAHPFINMLRLQRFVIDYKIYIK